MPKYRAFFGLFLEDRGFVPVAIQTDLVNLDAAATQPVPRESKLSKHRKVLETFRVWLTCVSQNSITCGNQGSKFNTRGTQTVDSNGMAFLFVTLNGNMDDNDDITPWRKLQGSSMAARDARDEIDRR